ncbi:permease-like cell division protein FtsX [Streptococcus koreensis]|uniref:permease-like cell division protein FtsX n=1 Tax=Streptococcus koreensis TaxID=2382163 RepID=UPI0022E706CF|nr:permease-like cell division protein FtsX [Streptococcus koreensis]
MIRRFFRHLIESFKSLKRNGWMTIAAVSSVMITLGLVAIFASVIANTIKLSDDIQNSVRIVVYMRKDIQDQSPQIEKEGQMVDNEDYKKVYNALTAMKNVDKVEFSSKEEQYENLIKTAGNNWKIFDGDANPLYDAYFVETTAPKYVKEVSKAAKKIEGVSEVKDGGVDTQRLFALGNFIRIWGLIGAGLLIFIAVFLISNTIRITIISRSREIKIMRLVGAKSGYIRAPFLLEGAWIGLIGAIPPALLLYYVYNIVYKSMYNTLQDQKLFLYSPNLLVPIMVGGLFGLGILIGAIGSSISMRRFLKI